MDPYFSINDYYLVGLIICAISAYIATVGVYRLYFSPISNFPGPKLAALTLWYQFYHNSIRRGKYAYIIDALHAQYGPIVRINPYELHISDSTFYDKLYGGPGSIRDKWLWDSVPGLDNSVFTTMPHDLHKLRRSAVDPYFSIRNVRKLQPVIEKAVEKVVGHLLKKKGCVAMDANALFAAFTNDVVMEYSFGRSEKRLDAEVIDPLFYTSTVSGGENAQSIKYFRWVMGFILAMPEWLLRKEPGIASFLAQRQEMFQQVVQTQEESRKPRTESADRPHLTIFHDILDSKLPADEKSPLRLAGEAQIIVGAGTVTTSWNITVAFYYLLSQPAVLLKLKEELEIAIPDHNISVPLVVLENLPYLTGVIKETLRLSNGVTGPLPRISPKEAIAYRGWSIPPGTPVSMSMRDIHNDESIFPDSKSFRPERWIENPNISKYLVAFTKGSRQCLGQNLAYAEMYCILAGIFRRFGTSKVTRHGDIGLLELFETDDSDIDVVGHIFLPLVKADSKGVRFKVLDSKVF